VGAGAYRDASAAVSLIMPVARVLSTPSEAAGPTRERDQLLSTASDGPRADGREDTHAGAANADERVQSGYHRLKPPSLPRVRVIREEITEEASRNDPRRE